MDIIPGLKGFGTDTRAAYGAANDPKIFIVTNTNHSNGTPGTAYRNGTQVRTGSFLEALNYNPGTNTGKLIMFEVSGTINATSSPYVYRIPYPYTTIVGQTAPSPGITLRNIVLQAQTHDILVQHIRSRIGDAPAEQGEDPDNRRPFQMTSWSVGGSDVYNVVYDHLSGGWSIDTMGLFWEEGGYQTYNCTWSNSIFSEPLDNSLHSKGAHGYGPVIYCGTTNIAFLKNFFASSTARNPLIRRSTNVLVNNYIYNAKDHNVQFDILSGVVTSSTVGNLIEGGPSSGVYAYTTHFSSKNMTTSSEIYLYDNKCGKDGVSWHTQSSARDWSHVRWWGLQGDISADVKVLTAPIWPTGLVAMDVNDVKSYVLANAGARPADRDSADKRVIAHAKSNGRQGRIIDSPSDVGGWPTLAENKITLSIPANPHAVSGDGYTNLEKWLHQLAAEVEGKELDTTPPTITSFTTETPLTKINVPITFDYTVKDETSLDYVELHITTDKNGVPDEDNWVLIGSSNVSGTSVSGSFVDNVQVPGTYWYGMYVFDGAGNVGAEQSAIMVVVTDGTPISCAFEIKKKILTFVQNFM